MTGPGQDEEENYDDVCSIHDHSLPCPHCLDEQADRRYDADRDTLS